MQHIEVHQHIPAPIDVVWARYTDHVSWTEWAGFGPVRLAREGVPAPNGVGCVREMGRPPFTVQEEVVTWEPPHRMTYRIVRGGLPIRDHLGEVTFAAANGGTDITWRCRFASRIPGLGGAFRALVTGLFRRALRSLARDLS